MRSCAAATCQRSGNMLDGNCSDPDSLSTTLQLWGIYECGMAYHFYENDFICEYPKERTTWASESGNCTLNSWSGFWYQISFLPVAQMYAYGFVCGDTCTDCKFYGFGPMEDCTINHWLWEGGGTVVDDFNCPP